MAWKMSAREFRTLCEQAGWARPEDVSSHLGISFRSVYTYRKSGCPLKGVSNRMRKQFEQAITERGAA